MTSDENEDKKLVISDEDLDATESASENAPTQVLPPAPPPVPKGKAAKGAPHAPVQARTSEPIAAPAKTSFLQRNGRKMALGAGAVLALAIGFIVAFVVLGLFDSSETEVREALVASNEDFETVSDDVAEAADNNRPLTALRDTAPVAKESADAISERSETIQNSVDDGRIANPALDLMAAEVAFLEEIASIEKISDNELDSGARDLRNALEKSQDEIEAAREDVNALALAAGEPLAPADELLASTIDASEGVLVESDKALAEWQAEVDELEAQGESALQVAQTYQDSMSSLMDQYFQQRDETRALVERDRVFFTEASRELRAMAAARGGIISQMQALTVPPGAETAHSTMVNLASRSRDILEQAATTTETDPFPIWTGSPGYQQLNSSSDQISAEYEPARQGVLTAAEKAIQDAQSQDDLPPKPKL